MGKFFFASVYNLVRWAKARLRAVPTIINQSGVRGKMVGTAQVRLCPPYGLSPARADAAVDREDHARGVAGAVRRQECHQVADLARVRGTPQRQALLKFLVAVFVAELVFRARLQQRDVAVGADR